MNLKKLKIKFKNNKKTAWIYSILKKIYFNIQKIIINFFCIVFNIFPIKSNKVVVVNYNGKGYGDNIKYIVQQLLSLDKNIDIVWLISNEDQSKEIPNNIRCIKNESLKALYELSTAKVWIDNTIKRFKPLKRKKQIYIQTWHAGLGMKKVGVEVKNCDATYLKQTRDDAKITDIVISNSDYRNSSFKNNFGYTCEIMKIGLPRNDILVNDNKINKDCIKEKINIFSETKILMYAPTFRRDSTIEVYDIDLMEVKKSLEKKYGGEWVILLRLHPYISVFSSDLKNNDTFIDVTNYPDLAELLLVTDFLISDYSSLIFDYSISKKPAMIYAPDLDNYIEQDQLAVSPKELPYEISKNNIELKNKIENFDEKKYVLKLDEYFKKNGLVEEGTASKKICNRILKIMGEI